MISLIRVSTLLLISTLGLSAQSVLFVGNSFTHGPKDFMQGSVTDLHGGKVGGIPAIFRKISKEGGKDPQVSHELSGGKTLEWHFAEQADKLKQPWDIVILQDYSTRPLVSDAGNDRGTNREAFRKGVEDIKGLVESENPEVKIYLYETWARPDRILKGYFENLDAMQDELREGYSQAAADYELAGWAPVGDSFVEAVKRGISDNPATVEITEGPIDVWGGDKYHQSWAGAYLSAMVFYATIYQADPRELPTDAGSAAARLKIAPDNAKALQELAYDMTLAKPE